MPKTLLLADDSVVIQKLVGLSFANEDVELTTTDNGDDAIARARELKPDLVLADVVMPGKNGYEVCEAIKADPNLQHTPVLLLTGTFEAFDEARARAAGSDGHITKPFEAQALVDRVTELLANIPAAPPLATTAPNLDGPAVTQIRAARDDDAFEFFDDGVKDLDTSGETAVAAPPPLPPSPSPLAEVTPPPSPSQLPPLDRPNPPDETIALIPDAPVETTAPIDNFAFDTSGDAATKIDLGDDPGHPPVQQEPIAALDDFLLDEAPAWNDDLQIGSEPAATPTDDLFDAAPAADSEGSTPLDLDAIDIGRSSSHIMSEGDNSSDSIVFGDTPVPPQRPAAEGMRTMLADDLFGDAPAPPPIPVASPVGDPALDSVDDLMSEPERSTAVADEFDVSSSDLAQSIPAMPPFEPEPAPLVAERPTTELLDEAPIAEASSDDAFSVSDGLLVGAPATAETSSEMPEADVVPMADPMPPAGPDLTPIMRDRVHETLERVAWEALSDLSDTVVRQVVEKIESIAWEVIPQMAETIIKEEIRRMKGDTDE